MNIPQQQNSDRPHTIRCTNLSGTVREYSYKIVVVPGPLGRPTTISVDHQIYSAARARYRISQAEFSRTVRSAAAQVRESGAGTARGTFSSAVAARALRMFEARRLGVALDDYLYAESNNAAWP